MWGINLSSKINICCRWISVDFQRSPDTCFFSKTLKWLPVEFFFFLFFLEPWRSVVDVQAFPSSAFSFCAWQMFWQMNMAHMPLFIVLLYSFGQSCLVERFFHFFLDIMLNAFALAVEVSELVLGHYIISNIYNVLACHPCLSPAEKVKKKLFCEKYSTSVKHTFQKFFKVFAS